ncbi:MAG: helix-turn-helix transcriptional regulator [Salinarimonas sp.]|nr:helix-turn-helix transcriptional regulator [Salinarimonas sp.]
MDTRKPSDIDRLVGQRVRLARKIAKLSQSKLGDSVGVTYQQIQKYENGTDRVGAGRLYRIAQETDQPISFFFSGDEFASNVGKSNDILADPQMQKLLAAISGLENKKFLHNLASIADTFAMSDEDA